MREVLTPYSNFETEDLADALHAAATAGSRELRIRNMPDIIERYGSHDKSEVMYCVEKDVEDDTREHFAIVSTGRIIGAAEIDYNSKPTIARTPLPLIPLGRTLLEYAGPRISAWANPEVYDKDDIGNSLRLAYESLVKKFCIEDPLRGHVWAGRAWASEPKQSPWHVHRAITDSGLQGVTTRYVHRAGGQPIPPKSILYVHLEHQQQPETVILADLCAEDPQTTARQTSRTST